MNFLQNNAVHEKCAECGLQMDGFFCQLPADGLRRFEAITITRSYPKGGTLFVEGQPAKGVFMLCKGKVKLSTCSQYGKTIILEIAGPGDILGLSTVLNGHEHETTAEVLEQCQVKFVKTSELLRFLRSNPEASFNAVRQLSRNYQTAHRQICALGLSDSVADKLAKLFLGWSENGNGIKSSNGNGNSKGPEVRIKNFFTHEEMAEMIGASRETVTRVLRCFRESDLVTLRGSDLIIHDRKRLRSAIGNRLPKRNGFGSQL